MNDIIEYINEDAEMAAIEIEEVEGTVFGGQAPVLATPAAIATAAFAGGFVIGRAVG
ncbi:hypothetical protein [Streptomyces sp. ALI-76-A]|uniref:hypothetical protein n=1 Tax=Streptomyces sp. ALI-76-A TaxID=3025736 RepID=UPI00256EF0B5|nr:hypothetical protein [Streptomyces sp. ALI-76-A]MDL5206013.1 hypothetical protein [Streptomyces sp. ALI-76-A]